jgi:hypothetical protein
MEMDEEEDRKRDQLFQVHFPIHRQYRYIADVKAWGARSASLIDCGGEISNC